MICISIQSECTCITYNYPFLILNASKIRQFSGLATISKAKIEHIQHAQGLTIVLDQQMPSSVLNVEIKIITRLRHQLG